MGNRPRMNTLFRIQTMLVLVNRELSGYDLAKRIEEISGKKPSSGKLYPFLKQLRDNNYITEVDIEDDSDRSKSVYRLTEEGHNLVDELLNRMAGILDARLEQMLDTCHSCLVKIYDTSISGINQRGEEVVYCCEHCKMNYYRQHEIS